MTENLKNYQLTQVGTLSALTEKGRVEIGDTIGLTGCEVSLNSLPAETGSPFIHAHKQNEEVYLILNGSGIFYVDEEEFLVQEGTTIRVAPAGKRALKAGKEGLLYLCIQAAANSLRQKTHNDGIMIDLQYV